MNARKTSAPDVGRFSGYIPKEHTLLYVRPSSTLQLFIIREMKWLSKTFVLI